MRRSLFCLVVLSLAVSLCAQDQTTGTASPQSPQRDAITGLPGNLAAMRNYRTMRVSSEDRAGNADMRRIEPGQTFTLAELEGPGEITHFWTTIASPDPMHLRNLVIRIYWDGMDQPSVESPIGDFYGLGLGKYYYFSNPVQAIGTNNGMNCFWPMPFAKSARITVTNDGDQGVHAFYYYVDWRKYETMPENVGYFHAQYRQAVPNEDKKPYLILNTSGAAGHFVGVSLSILTQVAGWWGEGDDIFTIDGEERPSLWGTGSEDYFCGAWCYGKTFYTDYFGMPLREQENQSANNYWNVYRLHLESPVAFQQSLKVEIEHGASGFDNTRSNGRNNDYYSVAYYYLASPQAVEGPLADAPARVPEFRQPDVARGVYEPQYMKVVKQSETLNADAQDMGGHGRAGHAWLNQDQMFGRGKSGDKVTLEFETTDTVKGAAVLRMTKAPDYGRVRVELNGKTLVNSFNGYADQVTTAIVKVGNVTLEKGKHQLVVTTLGKDERSKNTYWGIDYLRIGDKPTELEPTAKGDDDSDREKRPARKPQRKAGRR